jgi:hypothetical protein
MMLYMKTKQPRTMLMNEFGKYVAQQWDGDPMHLDTRLVASGTGRSRGVATRNLNAALARGVRYVG